MQIENLHNENIKDESCCTVSCEKPLDENYWEAQYKANITGWDLGEISPPIKQYIDNLPNRNTSILIPGCGNTYEAEYLLSQGFTNITVLDIAPTLIKNLQKKFERNKNIKIISADFFEHNLTYDLIIEQTFFCALPPTLRQKYVWKMHSLLNTNGKLVGLLFNRNFLQGPPFGGSKLEYEKLFAEAFKFEKLDDCKTSAKPRAGTELWFEFKNNNVAVSLYKIQGVTCSGCIKTISYLFAEIHGVFKTSFSKDFTEILIVSKTEIDLPILQAELKYDSKYKIEKIKI